MVEINLICLGERERERLQNAVDLHGWDKLKLLIYERALTKCLNLHSWDKLFIGDRPYKIL